MTAAPEQPDPVEYPSAWKPRERRELDEAEREERLIAAVREATDG